MNVAKIASTWAAGVATRALLLTMALACGPNFVFGTEIYRWQDEQGNPVISDRRPAPGTPYTTLNPARLGIAPGKRSALDNAPAISLPHSETTKTATSLPANLASKPANTTQTICSRIADSIDKLERLPRISVREPNGSSRFLSDTEREVKLSEALKRRDEQCR